MRDLASEDWLAEMEREEARQPARQRLARQKINKAKREGTTTLSLSYMQLRELPPELFALTKLKTLKSNNNSIKNIPADIKNLRNLRILKCYDNHIHNLPPEIGHLRNLTELDLGSNGLTALPKEVGDLRKLKKLACRRNQLSELPKEIGKLRQLQYLWLRGNNITQLPSQIGDLGNLRDLDLRWNQISYLPKSVGKLNSLITHAKAEGGTGHGLVLDGNPLEGTLRDLALEFEHPHVTGAIIRYLEVAPEDRLRAESTTSPSISGDVSGPSRQAVYQVSFGLQQNLLSEIEKLKSHQPNGHAAQMRWIEQISILEKVSVSLQRIIDKIGSDADSQRLRPFDQNLKFIFDELTEEIRQWISENKPEMVDWLFRMPAIISLIGLLNLVGANMYWATPLVFAVTTGKKTLGIIKSIIKSYKSKG